MISMTGSWIDALALFNLLLCWVGYTRYAAWKGKRSLCLASVMARYRQEWMQEMLQRDNRISDASLVNSLRSNVSFFASTSILIIAGLITGTAASEEAVSVLSTLPFVTTHTRALWELKVLVMLVVFVYSFFAFTWSLRLYNFSCVLVGSAPQVTETGMLSAQHILFARRASQIMTLASKYSNYGLRSYYFALATIAWFINPLLFIASTLLVVVILYRREFHSAVLETLAGEKPEGKLEDKTGSKQMLPNQASLAVISGRPMMMR